MKEVGKRGTRVLQRRRRSANTSTWHPPQTPPRPCPLPWAPLTVVGGAPVDHGKLGAQLAALDLVGCGVPPSHGKGLGGGQPLLDQLIHHSLVLLELRPLLQVTCRGREGAGWGGGWGVVQAGAGRRDARTLRATAAVFGGVGGGGAGKVFDAAPPPAAHPAPRVWLAGDRTFQPTPPFNPHRSTHPTFQPTPTHPLPAHPPTHHQFTHPPTPTHLVEGGEVLVRRLKGGGGGATGVLQHPRGCGWVSGGVGGWGSVWVDVGGHVCVCVLGVVCVWALVGMCVCVVVVVGGRRKSAVQGCRVPATHARARARPSFAHRGYSQGRWGARPAGPRGT